MNRRQETTWIPGSPQRFRVAIAHPFLGHGGSESRAAWLLQGFEDFAPVALLTTGPFDLQALNRFCGVALAPERVRVRRPALPWRMLGAGGAALRGAIFERFCRSVASQFDLRISAYNFCDFGAPGIHCLADFSWNEQLRNTLHPPRPGTRGSLRRIPGVRSAYESLVRLVAGTSGRPPPAPDDLIVANSQWSARLLREQFDLDAPVVYPPVPDAPAARPWAQREDGFVAMGRLSHEKRIEEIIAMLKAVREKGFRLTLHLVGRADAPSYERRLRRVIEAERAWVRHHGLLEGAEKWALLSSQRYGLHACRGEAFGIAVAEMVKAGCIPFVPETGGPAEIVNHPLLIYRDASDAVEKIARILRYPVLCGPLAGHLADQARRFSAARFVQDMRALALNFAAGLPQRRTP